AMPATVRLPYSTLFRSPEKPEVKINDMEAILYKMEDMMTFSIVENFTIPIDPRMPSMGNHSSPNNEDLTYRHTSETYKGKLSLRSEEHTSELQSRFDLV